MLILFLINLIVGSLLIWSGYLIYNKKKYNLIAGYNDMNAEQRKSVDIKRQSKALKIVLYFIGISIAIVPSSLQILGYSNWGWVYSVIILPAAAYYIIISILSISGKMKEGSNNN
jgi:predicted ferric reductase